MNILWLASWYPNRTNPSTGDFIERHARSVAPFLTNLFVVAVLKDEHLTPGSTEIFRSSSNNLHTFIAYYAPGKLGRFLEPLHSAFVYFKLQRRLFGEIVRTFGLPHLIHVHVAMKAGWFALRIKKKHRIPYLVTEHWTGYDPGARPNLKEMGNWFVMLTKKILNGASMLLPVSQNLRQQIGSYGIKTTCTVIPNMVDTHLFRFEPRPAGVFRFVHFSYLNSQKNPEGIIDACALLRGKGILFECLLAGGVAPHLNEKIRALGLAGNVFTAPEMPLGSVAEKMREAHALVMFSRFENLPCVVLEALCSGLPVVCSDVGGVAEIINDSNGMLVASGDVEALANAMERMVKEYARFNRQEIALASAAVFNPTRIGEQHLAVYRKLLSH
jgi:glycosyltransferase involved in cell wall biosynthesis